MLLRHKGINRSAIHSLLGLSTCRAEQSCQCCHAVVAGCPCSSSDEVGSLRGASKAGARPACRPSGYEVGSFRGASKAGARPACRQSGPHTIAEYSASTLPMLTSRWQRVDIQSCLWSPSAAVMSHDGCRQHAVMAGGIASELHNGYFQGHGRKVLFHALTAVSSLAAACSAPVSSLAAAFHCAVLLFSSRLVRSFCHRFPHSM